MTPYRVDIYIGSDNGSRKICKNYLNKVRDWANSTFPDGYTLVRGEGCYRGISEDSILLNVLSDYDVVLRERLKKLKLNLKQDSILVVKSAVNVEVI